jgi:hypothetical protein
MPLALPSCKWHALLKRAGQAAYPFAGQAVSQEGKLAGQAASPEGKLALLKRAARQACRASGDIYIYIERERERLFYV